MRKTVASNEQEGADWEKPEVDEVEDGDKIAQVEEEIVPGAFFVLIISERQEIEPLYRIGNVDPSNLQSETRSSQIRACDVLGREAKNQGSEQ